MRRQGIPFFDRLAVQALVIDLERVEVTAPALHWRQALFVGELADVVVARNAAVLAMNGFRKDGFVNMQGSKGPGGQLLGEVGLSVTEEALLVFLGRSDAGDQQQSPPQKD